MRCMTLIRASERLHELQAHLAADLSTRQRELVDAAAAATDGDELLVGVEEAIILRALACHEAARLAACRAAAELHQSIEKKQQQGNVSDR